ncbi:MAG: hypothetical protein ACRDO8_09725 [Nocardioidaceae bacterium]
MAEQIPGPSEQPPAAQRLTRNRWSDPRLLVGIVLVAAAIVAGAVIVEASDDTMPVWALRVDAHAGDTPRISDLERVDVHVGGSVAEHYLSGSEARVADRLGSSVWAHDVPAGELLAGSALVGRQEERAGELPLSVAVGSLPADLRPGQRVDVWVGPGRAAGGDREDADRVLEHVRVQAVRARSAALGEGSARVVLVALDDSAVDDLGSVLARVGHGSVTLVRVGDRGAS